MKNGFTMIAYMAIYFLTRSLIIDVIDGGSLRLYSESLFFGVGLYLLMKKAIEIKQKSTKRLTKY